MHIISKKITTYNKIFYIFLIISCLFNALKSQTLNPVEINVELASSNKILRAGEMFNIEINALMDNQWHIYSVNKITEGPLATEINIYGNNVIYLNKVYEPEPIEIFDTGFDAISFYHEGNTKFIVPVGIRENTIPGNYSFIIEFKFQVCNERLCYPPKTKIDTININIESGLPRDEYKMILPENIQEESKFSESLLNILLLAVGGAILSWVMPCVYPMIPIIISFFGKLSEEKNISKTVVASFYGFGIVSTFTFIGLLVGILSWGVTDISSRAEYANIGNHIATNAWVNLSLAGLFLFFAFWMFGLINVNIAGKLLNQTNKAGEGAKNAYFGSYILGLVFSITSFSCTVPVVGTLLVFATTGTLEGLITSSLGMTIYGLVFAGPFVALSLFPKTLNKLPNSGVWMNTFKVSFGFIELIAAVKFLWVPDLEWGLGILSRGVVLFLFAIISFSLLLFLTGTYSFGLGEKIKPFNIGFGRLLSSFFAMILFLPIFLSLISAPTYYYENLPVLANEIIESLVPPPPTEDELAIKEGWFVDNYDDALQQAKKEGKPLFIDFTGIYCANCRVMERTVFKTDSVKSIFDKMVLVRLYVDKKDSLSKVYSEMQFERYQQATQPYYVLLDPENENTIVDTGGYVPNGFNKFLEKGLKNYQLNRFEF